MDQHINSFQNEVQYQIKKKIPDNKFFFTNCSNIFIGSYFKKLLYNYSSITSVHLDRRILH